MLRLVAFVVLVAKLAGLVGTEKVNEVLKYLNVKAQKLLGIRVIKFI